MDDSSYVMWDNWAKKRFGEPVYDNWLDKYKEIFYPTDFDSDYWRSVEGPRLLFGHDSAETRRQKLKNTEK